MNSYFECMNGNFKILIVSYFCKLNLYMTFAQTLRIILYKNKVSPNLYGFLYQTL